MPRKEFCYSIYRSIHSRSIYKQWKVERGFFNKIDTHHVKCHNSSVIFILNVCALEKSFFLQFGWAFLTSKAQILCLILFVYKAAFSFHSFSFESGVQLIKQKWILCIPVFFISHTCTVSLYSKSSSPDCCTNVVNMKWHKQFNNRALIHIVN